MSEPQFRVIDAAQGKLWLQEARVFMRSNGKSLFRATILLVLLWSLVQIPVLGMVIGIFDPMLRGGLLLGIAATFMQLNMRQGAQPAKSINLLDAWQKTELRQPLIYLGLVLIAVSLLFSLWVAADLHLLQEGIAAGAIPVDAFQRLLFAIAVNMTVVGLALWLGLPELVFRGGSPLRAIVRGIEATMANWRALGMMGLWLALVIFAAILLLTVLGMVLISILPASPLFGFIALLPGVFTMIYLTAFLFVLQFICWRDIFSPVENDQSPAIEDNDYTEETRVVL